MGLLLGKLLPYLMIGFFELCMILVFMRFIFSACHSWQRASASPAFPAVHLRVALARHPDFQQSQFPSRSYAARFLTNSSEHLFSGYIFPRENHAQILLRPQLLRPGHLFHRHHPRIILRGAGWVHLWSMPSPSSSWARCCW